MRSLMSAALVTAMVASTLISASGEAFARDRHRDRDRHNYGNRDQYVSSYCSQHPRSRDCRDWQRNGKRWDDNTYRGFYERNHRDNNDAAVAALFGIVIGAAVASSAQSSGNVQYSNSHVRACANRYRSYDARTDSFTGYDGRRYRCTL